MSLLLRSFRVAFMLSGIVFLTSPMLYAQGIYNIWATTATKGPNNFGSLCSASGSGTNITLKGAFPVTNPGTGFGNAPMAFYGGKFYGLFSDGGANGLGLLYEYDPVANSYVSKVDFAGAGNGGQPLAGLTVMGSKLYGLTYVGGANGMGGLFEYDPVSGVLTLKVSMNAASGGYAQSTLTAYNGKLYGTTVSGGGNDHGTLFEYDPASNILTPKANFSSSLNYVTGLTVYGTSLYGVACNGGSLNSGAMIAYSPSLNTLTNLYNFSPSVEGGYCYGLVVYGSKLYGTTNQGGAIGNGSVFAFDPATNTTATTAFNGATGNQGRGLCVYGSTLYGTTSSGGNNYAGTIFECNPATLAVTVKVSLSYTSNGYPTAPLASDGTNLYGVLSNAPAPANNGGGGGIYQYVPAATSIVLKQYLNLAPNGYSPTATPAYCLRKVFVITSQGGANNAGTLMQYDMALATFTKVLDFSNTGTYRPPTGEGAVTFGNKIYWLTGDGGANNLGSICSYDPATATTSIVYSMANASGANPFGGLLVYNNLLYGVNGYGTGAYSTGNIFSYNTTTSAYTPIAALPAASTIGSNFTGALTPYNGYFYGTMNSGGAGGAGTMFSFNTTAPAFAVLHNFSYSDDYYLKGTTVFNGKLYGVTNYGGIYSRGTIFSYDPAGPGTFTARLVNTNASSYPQNTFVVNNGKLYNVSYGGGIEGSGDIFSYDGVSNGTSSTGSFTSTTGYSPRGGLLLVPADVAPASAGSCSPQGTVTINSSNNNTWVPITDAQGRAVGEIRANGNNLGNVTTSVYVNSGAVREDPYNSLYLDRNITITPATQPATPVDLRLYITQQELTAISNATNSQSQPSGVSSIADLAIYKNTDACLNHVVASTTRFFATSGSFGNGYYLQASIPSFSSFYFAGSPVVSLPVKLIGFSAEAAGTANSIHWESASESQLENYTLEVSTNARSFTSLTVVGATGEAHTYRFSHEAAPQSAWYRLKATDRDGSVTYSNTVAVTRAQSALAGLHPNPANGSTITVNWSAATDGSIADISIFDMTGRSVRSVQLHGVRGSNSTPVDIKGLLPGGYLVKFRGMDGDVSTSRLVIGE